ncbi:glutathione-dependent formaldehyde-activating GFA [[Leptolyngbya] sp. PCC 7376]|uniref:GFA family protein n=1 Tax=[Leptolyngbya] sp. PCC 7376 TaxID=111781 RepID=UPI00029EF9D1|nr:GFA family protein [[Leptolyngbya] sp. PCC 7376]AFY37893.1 glutathione-dependent formaldehyde-activating GFA [[Leptolyngbya] sp. PCC 7376]
MTLQAKGNCLCKSITLEVTLENSSVGTCHCNMCRQWASGPFFALDCGTNVKITGEENVTVFESSEWAERSFCNKCGSNLFYRVKATGQHFMAAGLFDLDQELLFDHQVFIDEKPDFYNFANDTKNMTGAELFAQFSESSG